jgi:hypothetical protein
MVKSLSALPTENCLLCFIQIALLDCHGDGRYISSTRARELGAADEISEWAWASAEVCAEYQTLTRRRCRYFSRWPTAFSQQEYERAQCANSPPVHSQHTPPPPNPAHFAARFGHVLVTKEFCFLHELFAGG